MNKERIAEMISNGRLFLRTDNEIAKQIFTEVEEWLGTWQPETTAPKEDGKIILILSKLKGFYRVNLGWWSNDRYEGDKGEWWIEHSEGGQYLKPDEFIGWIDIPDIPEDKHGNDNS